jgi:hypothetical protein
VEDLVLILEQLLLLAEVLEVVLQQVRRVRVQLGRAIYQTFHLHKDLVVELPILVRLMLEVAVVAEHQQMDRTDLLVLVAPVAMVLIQPSLALM